ncbi:hypothetical protein ABEX53_21210 [Bacillus toyonensis]|nr:hypothetical protein [Bacillus toyonensis]MED3540504.1 hypothetical protein [Bacillus toyonensis]MEE2019698.1 hypothetical protein [Bacillus toyonensis]
MKYFKPFCLEVFATIKKEQFAYEFALFFNWKFGVRRNVKNYVK